MAAAVAIGHAHGDTPRPVRVVVVGDSIAAALAYQPSMERAVAKGFNVKFDLQVCRRLASAGCPYNGGVPSSALDAVHADFDRVSPGTSQRVVRFWQMSSDDAQTRAEDGAEV